MDSTKRFADLVELAKPRELPHSMTIEKCLQLLNEIYQMGSYYAGRGHDEERAFVFFLRYIGVVIEELPRHPLYTSLSSVDKHSLDIRTLNAINTAEQLKKRVKQRYEHEKELSQNIQVNGSNNYDHEMTASTSKILQKPNTILELDPLLISDQLNPYVRCHTVSRQPIVFQRIIIPNNMPELFLGQQLMDRNGVRFALLYGRLVNKSVIVSKIFPCTLDTITGRNYRRFVPDNQESDSIEDLPIVGCICSSLTTTCEAGFFRICQISEMVCIVCPPGPNRTILLHLVNMSPSGGHSPAQSNSTQTSSGFQCIHQHITNSIAATLVSHENSQQNGIVPRIDDENNKINNGLISKNETTDNQGNDR